MVLDSIRLLVGMLIVIALVLWLAYWFTRQVAAHGVGMGVLGRLTAMTGGTDRFCVVAQLSIGRGERLVLVRLAETCYLLAVTEHTVILLKELEGEAAREWLVQAKLPEQSGFLEVLRETLQKRK